MVDGLFSNCPIVLDFEEKKLKRTKNTTQEKDIQKLYEMFASSPTEQNFNQLVKRVRWGLRHKIYGIVRNNEAVNVVFNKTLTDIYFNINMYSAAGGKFSSWIYRIASNNALKWKERGDRISGSVDISIDDMYENTICENDNPKTASSKDIEAYSVNTFDIMYEGNEYKRYDKESVITDMYDVSVDSINNLPDNIRIVMYDRLVENKKIEDIAEDNGIPLSSVKNWIRKGKMLLQQDIKRHHRDLYEIYASMNDAV